MNGLPPGLEHRSSAGKCSLTSGYQPPGLPDQLTRWLPSAPDDGLGAEAGPTSTTPGSSNFVGELSLGSPRFSRLWARHDVNTCEGTLKRIDHPQVGGLWLNRERLGVSGATGQTLVILHPAPGTDSADRPALLASVTRT
ncbi:hypothetical protein [Streptosporangium sp. NPDC006930]|uniref:MmyB family transcriptional regulator n=1 Tax=Streptosporangium sp. NPDC006930 TaxID=3154783 RepID=UPI00341290C7